MKLLNRSEILELMADNPNSYHMILKYNYTEFYQYLMSCYFGNSLKECLYRYCNPGVYKCDTCGSFDVEFLEFTTGYRKYCSRYCTSHSKSQEKAVLIYRSDKSRLAAQVAKSKQTCLEKYGVEHWLQTKEGREHVSKTSAQIIKDRFPFEINGRTRKQYSAAARHLTNIIYDEYKDVLDPLNLRSYNWVLDHVYSVNDGFINEVPLDVLCHWTNLKLVSKSDNSSKGPKSGKSIIQLYEDYASPTSSIPEPVE